MNGCSIAGSDPGKADSRDPLVGKGCGVAGVNILIGLAAKAFLCRKVLDIVYQLFFTGAAGNKLAHNAADHIQVDIQNYIFKLCFVGGAVSLGAQ